MPGKPDTKLPTGENKPTDADPSPATGTAVVVAADQADAAYVRDKYEPPATNGEITQTDRLNKQLLESLLNRMQAAAQATTAQDDDEDDQLDTPPTSNTDWQ